jgi:hypothetical protein
MHPAVSGFDLDRDSQVQDSNNRDLKFRIHFVKPLQVQGFEYTFSLITRSRKMFITCETKF